MRFMALTALAAIGLLMIDGRAVSAVPGPAQSYDYGTDSLQALDYWPASRESAPLIIFIHGGGWKRGDKDNATGQQKVAHYHALGYAFASVNYRLVPDASVEQQASDVAAAIRWLRGHAAQLGFDPGRVVLMGHSAGAHLAALVGTDPRWLDQQGMTEQALSGVILLDGAAYNVPYQLAHGPGVMQQTYVQAFGRDPRRQRALSPTLNAAAPNARSFLILHVDRADGAV